MQVLPVFNFGSFICSLLCTWTDTKFPYRIFYCINSPSFCGDFRKLRLKEINPACVWILEIKIKLIKTYVEKENKTTNLIRIHWKLKRCSTIYSQGTNISIFYHRHKMKIIGISPVWFVFPETNARNYFRFIFCFLSHKAISMGYNLEINWPFIACVSTKSTPNESQFEFYERPSTLASDFNATRLGPMAAKLKIIDTLHWS